MTNPSPTDVPYEPWDATKAHDSTMASLTALGLSIDKLKHERDELLAAAETFTELSAGLFDYQPDADKAFDVLCVVIARCKL